MTTINAATWPNADNISFSTIHLLNSNFSAIKMASPFSIILSFLIGNLCPVPAFIIYFLDVAVWVKPPANSR